MKLALIDYPGVLKSAVYGLKEMFDLTNQLCAEQALIEPIELEIIEVFDHGEISAASNQSFTAIILPPAIGSSFYHEPSNAIKQWLIQKHQQGSILCSACAGAFILAATGLLEKREVTTHWRLATEFTEKYPSINLNANKIMINEHDLITAGGMLSWLDLGLELIAQFSSQDIMRQLGKILVVDTGQREQQYYRQFTPLLNHGDEQILKVQQKLQRIYGQPVIITELAKLAHMTERTFLRRFQKATRVNPSEYLQRLRIQKACDLLENSIQTFEAIAHKIGYEDINACRKIFFRITGLTPREFRKRFVKSHINAVN